MNWVSVIIFSENKKVLYLMFPTHDLSIFSNFHTATQNLRSGYTSTFISENHIFYT